jgi:hypothetical protein
LPKTRTKRGKSDTSSYKGREDAPLDPVYPELALGIGKGAKVAWKAINIAGEMRYLTAEGYKLLARSNIDTYRQIRREELKKK